MPSTVAVQAEVPVFDVSVAFTVALRDRTALTPPSRAWLQQPEVALDYGAIDAAAETRALGSAIVRACETVGFFSVRGYPAAQCATERALDQEMRRFFARPLDDKMAIPMSAGGKAWRGYFPVGGELTSGKPDLKEGLYFGEELGADDPRVRAGTPLFGANMFPATGNPAMKQLVIDHMAYCALLGHLLAALLAVGMDLPAAYFRDAALLADPLPLFRAFHYPGRKNLPPHLAGRAEREALWGVGEHTDYGFLTLLKQDEVGGLEAKGVDGAWISVPPLADALVINIGDALEALTDGLLRSTPHRVRTVSPDAMRISLPYFFDPGFAAPIRPLPLSAALRARAAANKQREVELGYKRWDESLNARDLLNSPTYGAYLVRKVSKVFPALAAARL